ncbi:hypothetical protein GJ744_006543 [Endocarpon pusillum]|uniref:Uncharacterized protein n=1 Tax=Endocarpon pusillum TaxID=364733 RepID=A0A8H7AT75_9EURO|nr:hypothetical protein GJ744_006543 [Endocarpon pusillum]
MRAFSEIDGASASVMAASRPTAVSDLDGIGADATPARATALPQNGCSLKNGTITEGLPAAIAAAVVPAPRSMMNHTRDVLE